MESAFLVRSKACLVKGFTPEDVVKQLVAKGLSPQQAQAVVNKPVVLKNGLSHSQAMTYVESMKKLGVQVKLERVAKSQPKAKQADVYPQLLAQLNRQVAKPAMSRAFRNSAIVAVISSLIAPLIYFAVIALLLAAIWQYYALIMGVDVGNIYLNILLYVLPGFVAVFLLAFLLSPLISHNYQSADIELDRKRYAKLYELCSALAKAIGVPAPHTIRVSNEVNASASGSALKLLQGKLTLTIGMPLVACMTVEQVVGVIAHEYGHFAQRKSMLAYIWINRVSAWLGRCGYDDGIWLERLTKWRSETSSELIIITLAVCQGMLIAVRTLFRQLWVINLHLTRNMSRQMEYDADQYEITMVGSKKFVESSKRLHYAAAASGFASELNAMAYFEHDQLVSNTSLATQTVLAAMPSDIVERINQQMKQMQTQFYDTHPADYDRIKRAVAANQPGIFVCPLPASILFDDYERLCRSATHKAYRATGQILDLTECLTDRPNWLDAPFGEPTPLRQAG
ncbi:M48 family metallopeptidase [Salinibius halmophilus]|uniref:M48 family metallopeptidase n=1 Tax=Salinibius halmophilus TaxID=1853216 RepID=UPI000E667C95|nr:M48 family metallopeptidase [Salinibius halmophilus]